MNIREFLTIVKGLPKKKEGDSTLNHLNYLHKLIESHQISQDDDVNTFFNALINDDFFKAEHMPPSWSMRTYVSALTVIEDVLKSNTVIDATAAFIDIPGVLEKVLEKKRYFQREYKKNRRQQKPVVEEEAPHQIILEEDADDNSTHSTDPAPSCSDADMVSRSKMATDVAYALSLLQKYMRHEPDEFKKTFLEVVCEVLEKASSHE